MKIFLKKIQWIACAAILLTTSQGFCADESDPFTLWQDIKPVISQRENQTASKMKLSKDEVKALTRYLNTLKADDIAQLKALQKTMPKTTAELLIAIATRGVDKTEAENIAVYLQTVPTQYQIFKVSEFDENTSHIIGREWHEIDYSGEGMTWQGQKEKYKPYDITNFKTLDNLQKFFPVESSLPYFYKVYGKKSGD